MLNLPSTEFKQVTVSEAQKTQFVRLIDILFISPVLLYIAMKKKPLNLAEKTILASIGAGVLYYNSKRFLINKEILKKATKG